MPPGKFTRLDITGAVSGGGDLCAVPGVAADSGGEGSCGGGVCTVQEARTGEGGATGRGGEGLLTMTISCLQRLLCEAAVGSAEQWLNSVESTVT